MNKNKIRFLGGVLLMMLFSVMASAKTFDGINVVLKQSSVLSSCMGFPCVGLNTPIFWDEKKINDLMELRNNYKNSNQCIRDCFRLRNTYVDKLDYRLPVVFGKARLEDDSRRHAQRFWEQRREGVAKLMDNCRNSCHNAFGLRPVYVHFETR